MKLKSLETEMDLFNKSLAANQELLHFSVSKNQQLLDEVKTFVAFYLLVKIFLICRELA